MATTRISGKNLYAKFVSTVLSTNGRNFEVQHMQEQADATAGADDYRVFINTVKTIGASIEIIQASGSGGSAVIAALQPGAAGTLEWGPEGTASGKPKWGFYATIEDSSMSYPYDDVAVLNVKFQNSGSALVYNGATAVY